MSNTVLPETVRAKGRISRPTERAAIQAALETQKPLPDIHLIISDMIAAHLAGDVEGANQCARMVYRAANEKGTAAA